MPHGHGEWAHRQTHILIALLQQQLPKRESMSCSRRKQGRCKRAGALPPHFSAHFLPFLQSFNTGFPSHVLRYRLPHMFNSLVPPPLLDMWGPPLPSSFTFLLSHLSEWIWVHRVQRVDFRSGCHLLHTHICWDPLCPQ